MSLSIITTLAALLFFNINAHSQCVDGSALLNTGFVPPASSARIHHISKVNDNRILIEGRTSSSGAIIQRFIDTDNIIVFSGSWGTPGGFGFINRINVNDTQWVIEGQTGSTSSNLALALGTVNFVFQPNTSFIGGTGYQGTNVNYIAPFPLVGSFGQGLFIGERTAGFDSLSNFFIRCIDNLVFRNGFEP